MSASKPILSPRHVYDIAIASSLSAMALLLQLMPFWPTAWGMRIDLVAIPWFVALFLISRRAGLLALSVTSLLIVFISFEGWLGASMKFLATASLMIPIALTIPSRSAVLTKDAELHSKSSEGKGSGKRSASSNSPSSFPWLGFLIGVTLRSIIMLVANYWFALPLWVGLPVAEVIKAFPWYVIVIPNLVQSIIEVFGGWYLVVLTPLRRGLRFAPRS
ncbi:MAG: ECF transporter S component [archaeon]